MFSDLPPYRNHLFNVGQDQLLHVQESGCPDGLPARVLHGGPGSGCSPLQPRFFDPRRRRIVCVDQRGATLCLVPGAGHDPAQPAMAAAMVESLAAFADHSAWPKPPPR